MMLKSLRAAAAALALAAFATAADAADAVKIGLQAGGTVSWLMDSVKANKFDEKHGVALELVDLAGKDATTIGLVGGELDLIVTDWPWAMRQRAESGVDYRFAPYSSSLGAIMAGKDRGIKTLADLKGKKIGVAGGALDKSWLLVQAYAKEKAGFDIAKENEISFGASPLLNEQLKGGKLDAVVTFWHFAARLEGGGYPRVMGVSEIAPALGVDPAPALVGFVWSEANFKDKPAALEGFLAAVADANALLKDSDVEWDRIRPKMKAEDEGEYKALRQRFRDGIESGWDAARTTSAEALFKALAKAGGPELMGPKTTFDAGTFYTMKK